VVEEGEPVMEASLTATAVVRDGEFHVTEKFFRTGLREACRFWGDGVPLRLTIEPEPLAVSRGQRAYYFGAIVKPLVEYTGYPGEKWHKAFKKVLMPDDGRTSITQLTHDEMAEFMAVAEYYAVERHPEAFAEFEIKTRKRSGRRTAA
jgi:hypothetical protein